jgi:hypothetical protein
MAKQNTYGGVITQLESSLEDFFLKKLPGLPANIKEIIVKFGPWLALVGLVFSIPTLLAALGLQGVMTSGYLGNGYTYGYSLALWISIASMVLMAVALPGLFKRKMSAWKLMFYSALVMAVYNLVIFSLGSLIIGTGISLYILFQIKSYYK